MIMDGQPGPIEDPESDIEKKDREEQLRDELSKVYDIIRQQAAVIVKQDQVLTEKFGHEIDEIYKDKEDPIGKIRHLEEQTEQLRKECAHDSLTQLLRREAGIERLQEKLGKLDAEKESRRERKQGAIVFIDLNNIKSLNETIGYEATSGVLEQFSRRLHHLRKDDLAIRYGGDEFILYLHDADPIRAGYTIVKRILQSLEEDPIEVKDEEGEQKIVKISFAAGVRAVSSELSELPSDADESAYETITTQLMTEASVLEKDAKVISGHETTVLAFLNKKNERIILTEDQLLPKKEMIEENGKQ